MIKNVFVVGASGRVGRYVTQYLVEKGVHVYAGARNPKYFEETSEVTPVAMDIAHISVDELATLFESMDAVMFVAGSRSQDLLKVDAFGAVKAMQASEKAGVKRYIQLSSLYALNPERWDKEPFSSLTEGELTEFNIAKFFADRYLIDQTSLDYTIIQPSFLVDGPLTNTISTDITHATSYKNNIADVAMTLVESLFIDETKDRVIMMTEGDVPISEALKSNI